MKVNLMPPIPLARRFFGWWVSLILIIFCSGLVGVTWWYMEQAKQLQSLNKQVKALLPQETAALAKLKEKEKFIADHRAVLDYEKTVKQLKSENVYWEQALSALETSLPTEARLFNVKVKDQRFEAMAAFSSLDSIAYFESQIKKNPSVKDFMITSVEDASVVKEVQIKPATAKVVQFHFTFHPSSTTGVKGGMTP